MKYKVGETVRVRADLEINERYGVDTFIEEMGKFRGSLVCIQEVHRGSKYKIKGSDWNWTEEMFEPVPLFSSGIISLSNDPRLSDMKVTLQGFELRENANEVRDTPTRGKSVFKPMLDSISMRSALEKCISLAVESEFGTKKSTGIESRKDIRKRLLKL